MKSLLNDEVISVANDGIGTIAIYVPSADKTVSTCTQTHPIFRPAKVTKGQKIADEARAACAHPLRDAAGREDARRPKHQQPPTTFWQNQGHNVR